MSEMQAPYTARSDAADPCRAVSTEAERLLGLLESIRDTALSGLADVAGDGKDALTAIHRWASDALSTREEGARMR